MVFIFLFEIGVFLGWLEVFLDVDKVELLEVDFDDMNVLKVLFVEDVIGWDEEFSKYDREKRKKRWGLLKWFSDIYKIGILLSEVGMNKKFSNYKFCLYLNRSGKPDSNYLIR